MSLALKEITKRFGPVPALRGVDFVLQPGSVHALLGENGAGKSTLMHIAYGLVTADAGQVLIDGRPVTIGSPRTARAHGIGMVHQHFTSVPALTVAENIQLAGGQVDGTSDVLRGFLAGLDPHVRVEDLSVGLRQRLEIVKALATDARILLLDEPTAVLAPSETDDLIGAIRRFAAGGGSVVLITHKLDEALRAADTVTVLRQGRVTLSASIAGQTAETLAAAMIGDRREAGERREDGGEERETRSERTAGRPEHAVLLEAVSVPPIDGRGPGLREASLSLRPGELVGVGAIEGNGQRELMLVVAGLLAPASGRLDSSEPVALVPEDRTTEGLIPEFSLTENVALGHGRDAPWVRGRWIDWRLAGRHSARLIAEYDVLAPGPEVAAGTLSGGNQQKLILARALDQQPRVLVAENPTRGLDIRATALVHQHLRDAAAAGITVLMYSSDLEEVLDLAQRVVVVADGRLTEAPSPPERAVVGRMMLGIQQDKGPEALDRREARGARPEAGGDS